MRSPSFNHPLLLKRLSALEFLIKLLQYKKGFLLLTMIREKSLAIEIILKMRKRSSRTTKVLENPRRHSAKEGDALQHCDLLCIKIFLILLGPAGERIAMVAKKAHRRRTRS